MRKNYPVTDKEVVLRDDHMIVSRTDLKGVIDYVNPDFIEVSGFTSGELLGKPHNIVRHPDMPPAAFADFWRTLKSGRPWRGLVKNRCKNGDYYWVDANAAPLWKDGKVVGYMSLRRRASRADIDAADRLYRAINKGQARHVVILYGRAVSTLPWARLARAIQDCALRHKLLLLLLPALIGMPLALFGIAGPQQAISLLLGYVVLQAFAAAWFYRGLCAPLRAATAAVRGMAEGNFNVPIDVGRDDELGRLLQLLNTMQTKLGFLVAEVSRASEATRRASVDIAAGSREFKSRTQEQASQLQETAGSMEELSAAVKRNADGATQANQLAAGAFDVAQKGGVAVAGMVQSMERIAQSSKKIADIIGVIDGIAFQTNILALNAAVEAARAGEQGRGFAVVASEVRSLAQRSAGAAREIKALIEDSVNRIGQGEKEMQAVGRTMTDIIDSIRQVAELMTEIAAASREQSIGIDRVNQTIARIDEVIQQNVVLVEQAAAAADSMREQAEALSQAVAQMADSYGSRSEAEPA